MRDHAREAVEMLRNRVRTDLDRDRQLSLALVRLLEIIGEAAGRTEAQERLRHPGVPWNEIVGLRNRLIHGYDAIDFDILWQVVRRDLPPLIVTLDGIIRSEESRDL